MIPNIENAWCDVVRGRYGKGINGPDFIVEGLGDYSHITHIEIKNPVGSKIEIASLGKSDLILQGKQIGEKISNQQKKWSNADFVTNLPHVNRSESFPQSADNTLGVVDAFDVPISEKSIIENAVRGNSTHSIVFLNNEKNI